MGNIITIASENTKKNKGDGVNAVLTLMKDLRDFQDKVEACIESQSLTDNRDKIEKFYEGLDKMAEVLLEIAEGGIKSKRKLQNYEIIEDDTSSSQPSSVAMLNTPVIPRLR